MVNFWPFKPRTAPPAPANLHTYTQDLINLTKLRERAQMAQTMKKPGAAEEVARYDRMIAVAQETIIRIESKENKR